jgi:hypothetical protein
MSPEFCAVHAESDIISMLLFLLLFFACTSSAVLKVKIILEAESESYLLRVIPRHFPRDIGKTRTSESSYTTSSLRRELRAYPHLKDM